MSTLSVIKYSDLIQVSSVNRIVSRNPLVIEIEGSDFTSVSEVLVNDVALSEFIVVSKKIIYITLPSNIKQVRTLSVRSASFTKTDTGSIVEYKIGNKTKSVSGIIRLTQLFVRYLLTSPGSDIFNPTEGGGLQDIIGLIGTTGSDSSALGALSQAVRKASDDIIRAQSNTPGLSLDTRLLSAQLLHLGSANHTDSVEMRVLLTSYAGVDATANLVL